MTRADMHELEKQVQKELEAAHRDASRDVAAPARVPTVPDDVAEEARRELERTYDEESRGRSYRTGPDSEGWGRADEPAATFVAPDHGWQCPSCGTMFEQQGICPVDATPLRLIHRWEWTLPATGRTESVMDRGDDYYPAPAPVDWPLTAGRSA